MHGASSSLNPYPRMSSHGNTAGHAHGGDNCCMHEGAGKEGANFPTPGPLDRPKPPPPPSTSRPDPLSMTIVQCVQYGEMDRLKEFIANGADVRTPDDENVTLLHWAAINNRIEIVKYV